MSTTDPLRAAVLSLHGAIILLDQARRDVIISDIPDSTWDGLDLPNYMARLEAQLHRIYEYLRERQDDI